MADLNKGFQNLGISHLSEPESLNTDSDPLYKFGPYHIYVDEHNIHGILTSETNPKNETLHKVSGKCSKVTRIPQIVAFPGKLEINNPKLKGFEFFTNCPPNKSRFSHIVTWSHQDDQPRDQLTLVLGQAHIKAKVSRTENLEKDESAL